PYEDLLVAVLLGRLGLVEALQGPIVPLVETPVANDRKPHPVHFVHGDPEGADRPLEHGSVADVEVEPGLLQRTAGTAGFLSTGFGEIDIGPSREPVLEIPDALAMTKKNERWHGTSVSAFSDAGSIAKITASSSEASKRASTCQQDKLRDACGEGRQQQAGGEAPP